MTPALRDWLILGLLFAIAAVGIFALVRWLRDQRARAANLAAARRTEAELDGVRSGVVDTEQGKTDEEAWDTFKDNFGE